MNPSNEDYDLVARWLDGEPVELTAERKALAREIAGDLEAAGAALDVRLPPGTLRRARAAAQRASSEDYELVARRLDGEVVELTAEQNALGEEVAADFEAVGAALDVQLPPGTLHRVAAGLWPARPQPFVLKWHVQRAIATAAVIAVALGMIWLGTLETAPAGDMTADVYLRELIKNPDPGLGVEIDAVETDLASAHASVVLDEPSDLEVAVADLAEKVEEAFAEDQAAEDEAAWRDLLENM